MISRGAQRSRDGVTIAGGAWLKARRKTTGGSIVAWVMGEGKGKPSSATSTIFCDGRGARESIRVFWICNACKPRCMIGWSAIRLFVYSHWVVFRWTYVETKNCTIGIMVLYIERVRRMLPYITYVRQSSRHHTINAWLNKWLCVILYLVYLYT